MQITVAAKDRLKMVHTGDANGRMCFSIVIKRRQKEREGLH